jgi:hypothetical protein
MASWLIVEASHHHFPWIFGGHAFTAIKETS